MTKAARRIFLVLLFGGGLGYFLFTSFFFDPFEGSWTDQFPEGTEIAIERAVPREVDFFFHKRGLAADFENGEFPVPDLWDDVRLAKTFQRFESTPLADRIAADLKIGERVESLREALAGVPLLDPVDDMLGRDVAVFGRIAGFGYEQTEAAMLFLGSASMRFAWAAAGSSLLRSVFGIPLEVEEDDAGIRTITLQDGSVLHAVRSRDLFCVATGPGLVKEVDDLLRAGGQQSLGDARGYHRTVAQDDASFAGRSTRTATSGPPVDERVQLHVRVPPLLSKTEADEVFLEPRGELSRWLLSRLFNPRYYQSLTLDAGFPDALELRGTLAFERAMAESARTGFYNRKTFELREAMDEAASVLPEDTFFVMAARVDMQQFLPQIVEGLKEVDPSAVAIIDDVIARIRRARPDFRPQNALEAVRTASTFLGDDVVVAMRRDEYFGPPLHPTPLVCFFFDVTERGPSFDELRKSNGDPAKNRGYNGFVFPIMQAHGQLSAGGGSVANWFNVWHEGQGTPEERCIQEVILAGTEDLRNVAFGIIDPAKKQDGPWKLVLVLSPHTEKKDTQQANGVTKAEDYGTAQELIADVIKLHVMQQKERDRLAASGSPAAGRPGGVAIRDQIRGIERVVRPLSSAPKYTSGSAFLDGFASVAAFLDAKGLKSALSDRAGVHAGNATAIDWPKENARLSEELMNGEYAEWRGKTMTAKVKEDFDYALTQRKEELERRRVEIDVPRVREEYERSLAWVDLFQQAFLAARIDDKEQIIELRARVATTVR